MNAFLSAGADARATPRSRPLRVEATFHVGKFLCIGMNYVDHCAEQNVPVPAVPLVFSKFGSCVVGPGDAKCQ